MELFAFLLDSPVINALAKSLLHFLWQGVAIAFILYLALQVVSKRQSELRYVMSLGAMAMCVVAPICTFFWVYQPVTLVTADQLSPIVLASISGEFSASTGLQLLDWNNALSLMSILWMLGVVYLSVHLIFELIHVYKLPKAHVTNPDEELQAMFDRLVVRLQVNKLTRLLVSLKAEVPMVVGFIKPVVLVPFSMASGLTSAQLEMLLAHELAHVKRHDYLINFFQTLTEILLFFHPLVKWISDQVRIEREYCCDDIAVHTCGNVKAYATALTDAESIRSQNIPQLAMAATGGDLKDRVVRMIDQTDCSNKYSRSWHSMVLAALVALTMAFMLFSAHAGYQTRIADVLHDEVTAKEAIVKLEDSAIKSNKAVPSPTAATTSISAPQVTNESTIDARLLNTDMTIEPVGKMSESSNLVIAGADVTNASQSVIENNPAPVASLISNVDALDSKGLEVLSTEVEQPIVNTEQGLAVLQDDISDSEPLVERQIIDDPIETLIATTQSSVIDDIDDKAGREAVSQSVQVVTNSIISIIAPDLVRNARPSYPRTAIARGTEADVKVSFVVTTSGRIVEIQFEKDVPGYFKRSIRKALKHWRFKPGSIDGKNTEMTLTRIFSFTDPNAKITDPTSLRVTGSRIAKQI